MNNITYRKPFAIWFTGLSGSGKSTLSESLKYRLDSYFIPSKIFDGDIVRKGLNRDLSYSQEDRKENIRRIAEVNKLFLEEGFCVINAFISPRTDFRKQAREIIGGSNFIEIYLNTPIEACMKRDVKGLYKLALEGKLNNFTGVDDIFEPAENAELILDTLNYSIDECINVILEYLHTGRWLPEKNVKIISSVPPVA